MGEDSQGLAMRQRRVRCNRTNDRVDWSPSRGLSRCLHPLLDERFSVSRLFLIDLKCQAERRSSVKRRVGSEVNTHLVQLPDRQAR